MKFIHEERLENIYIASIAMENEETEEEPCQPCKTRLGKDLNHDHFSSRWEHLVETENKVIIFSNVLHGAIPTTGAEHEDSWILRNMEYEVINGSTMDLYRNWRAAYINDVNPMHVILLCDYREASIVTPSDMLKVIKAWNHELFTQHPASTLRMCKVIRCPAKCWFAGNGNPPADYTNYIQQFNELNYLIQEFNRKRGHHKVIGFSTAGCRSKRNGAIQHKTSDWRSEKQDWQESKLPTLPVRKNIMRNLKCYISKKLITELL